MRWIEARDRASRVLALPNQRRGLIEQYGLGREDVDREAWAIDRRGHRYAGAAAVNRTLRELGLPWRALAAPYGLAMIRRVEDAVYRWIARNRSLLSRVWSTTPECEREGSECA